MIRIANNFTLLGLAAAWQSLVRVAAREFWIYAYKVIIANILDRQVAVAMPAADAGSDSTDRPFPAFDRC